MQVSTSSTSTKLKKKSKTVVEGGASDTAVIEPVTQSAAKLPKPRVKKNKESVESAHPAPLPVPLPLPVHPDPVIVAHEESAAVAAVGVKAAVAKTKTKEPKVKKNKVKEGKKIKPVTTDTADPVGMSSLKKRGRKPKGGKIIVETDPTPSNVVESGTPMSGAVMHTSVASSNVILHLKCSYDDMHSNSISVFKYEPTVETIESYTDANDISETACEFTHASKPGDSATETEPAHAHSHMLHPPMHTHINVTVNPASAAGAAGLNLSLPNSNTNTLHTLDQREPSCYNSNANANANATESLKDIWKKINKLKIVLHHDNAMFNAVQHSACFWDTCKFDTPVIHIPKQYNKMTDSYTVYGCFCSPECAASYLIRESLDASVKFERLQMLNAMYTSICNNTDKPIKPAPDPRYMLDKYYGNLNIEEYRKLLKSDHLLYIVNKPLTHSLPELYDDNNEFLVNGKPATASGPCASAAATSVNGLGMGMGATSLKNKYAFSKSALVK